MIMFDSRMQLVVDNFQSYSRSKPNDRYYHRCSSYLPIMDEMNSHRRHRRHRHRYDQTSHITGLLRGRQGWVALTDSNTIPALNWEAITIGIAKNPPTHSLCSRKRCAIWRGRSAFIPWKMHRPFVYIGHAQIRCEARSSSRFNLFRIWLFSVAVTATAAQATNTPDRHRSPWALFYFSKLLVHVFFTLSLSLCLCLHSQKHFQEGKWKVKMQHKSKGCS